MADENKKLDEDMENIELDDTEEELNLEVGDDLEDESGDDEVADTGITIKVKKKKEDSSDDKKEAEEPKAEPSQEAVAESDSPQTAEEFVGEPVKKEEPKPVEEKPAEEAKKDEEPEEEYDTKIFAVRTTANREDQVVDFVVSNAEKKKIDILAVVRPHGMRGYIFLEARNRGDAEQAAYGVPYARGILPNEIQYKEIEHMLEQVKQEINIQKKDIVEIISGAFKREQARISRIDKQKEEVVVELLEAAIPIPITLKMDAVKVIRRDGEEPDVIDRG